MQEGVALARLLQFRIRLLLLKIVVFVTARSIHDLISCCKSYRKLVYQSSSIGSNCGEEVKWLF